MALLRGGAAAPLGERAGCVQLLTGTRTARGRARCPGHTRTRRACRQWVLGSGEEERRISAPNSICWRTWPAPRQAENSTHVRTCTQCWLCPRRALPSCCAPRIAPASACASGPPQPPEPPTENGAGARCSLEHPYATNQGQCRDARSFHLQLLFTCTTRSVRRRLPRRYHLERARLSAAHGGSRALLETGIWLQPSLQPPAQDQDGAESTHECPGSRQGTSTSPQFFSRFYLRAYYWRWENKALVLRCRSTYCPAGVEPQPSQGRGTSRACCKLEDGDNPGSSQS